MKRFLVFGGAIYYPSGGWDDFQVGFETMAEAREAVATNQLLPGWGGAWHWWHIVDLETGKKIYEGEKARE